MDVPISLAASVKEIQKHLGINDKVMTQDQQGGN
jgi:hypothetical protein